MALKGTLRDIGMMRGEVIEFTSNGLVHRPATEEDIHLYHRDRKFSAFQEAVSFSLHSHATFEPQPMDYMRPFVKKLCYDQSEDLGALYDALIPLCGNAVSVFFGDEVSDAITKCAGSDWANLVENYHNVQRKLPTYGNAAVFDDYIKLMAEKLDLSDDGTIISLARSLGRFPLFYAIDRSIPRIDPRLAEVARNGLCIYGDNRPLSDEEVQEASKYYSIIKYRIDAFIRCIQDDIEPLGYYRHTPTEVINTEEKTNFSTSFHYFLCFRLIPNTHYYGTIRPRVPDWAFTPTGREVFYVPFSYADKVRKVLDEACAKEPSRALLHDRGDIRFCFDRDRYNLVYGNNLRNTSRRVTAEEAWEKFKNSSSEQIAIPQIVIGECNRMLSKLGTGKKIEKYILMPAYY